MLPKDRFITKSSKLITYSNPPQKDKDTPVQFVKGVGPKLGSIFNSRQLNTAKDLLFFFPRSYEDRSEMLSISKLVDGVKATLILKVIQLRRIPIQKLGRSLLEVRCCDDTGEISLKWFYSPRGMERNFVPGKQLIVTGKVKIYRNRPEMVHPEITMGVAADTVHGVQELHPNIGRIVPIYTEIEGVPTRTLRKILWEVLESYGKLIEEDLPDYLLQKWKLPYLQDAVKKLHFPPDDPGYELECLVESNTLAHHRIIYGEFFKFEYLILRQRLDIDRTISPSLKPSQMAKEKWNSLFRQLPFQLTQGQLCAIKDIMEDLNKPQPMNRLVQGDVGSGKTVVAILSAAAILLKGGQVAFMAPTEILAEQHYKTVDRFIGDSAQVALLTGRTSNSERISIQSRLISGEPLLLIGTHALLEDSVQFNHLALVMIDEQHRFGVEQRKTLRQKGLKQCPSQSEIILPHFLILTATPIPRTLALTVFGDLSVTSIRELPPGRSPVETCVVREATQKKQVYEKIRQELKSGRQAYFIYPLVNDSEAEGFTDLKSAVAEAENLAQEIFPEFRIGLLHGQMKADEKEKVMNQFKKAEIQILVSTTVVEVGVDVPNASVIVIEHAERFGLSQLHQLRGRVGRGNIQSYCFLFAKKFNAGATLQRLEVLEETNDGFKIAEADLDIRGPGEFLGTRQAGDLPFKMANLVRDQEWLFRARNDVLELMKDDPDLLQPRHQVLKQYFENEGQKEFERLRTS